MTDIYKAAELALDALIWATGSADFGEGGIAREGAMKCLFPAIEALRSALAQPNEADELLRNLHLDPERYRTEGGAINHLKVRAAILNPRDYCDHEWVTAPASLGGQLCSKCGRMK